MIFLTIGSHEPFDRLVRAVDGWCATTGAEVFGQITERARYRPRHFPWTTHLTPADYDTKCREARFLIAHAGMGSIITAMTLAKPIAVLPRRGHLNETRNDHQYATAQKLGTKPGIFVADTEADLPQVLDRVRALAEDVALPPIRPHADDTLIAALRDLIDP